MSLLQDRQQWESEALRSPLPDGVRFSNDTIADVDCLWVSTRDNKSDVVVVYLHGGGLVAGSVLTHKHFAATMAKAIGTNILLVDYRLLPEHPYPAPLDDLVAVYEALMSSGTYRSNDLILGGDSSGAGLVLAALVQIREKGLSLPRCSFTLSGSFDMTLSGESMQTVRSDDPYMALSELEKWQSEYLPTDLDSPMLSPLFANLNDLPPLLLLAGGRDPWLSDSERVAEKIKAEGGQARLRVWPSMDHVWMMDNSYDETAEALTELREFCAIHSTEKKTP